MFVIIKPLLNAILLSNAKLRLHPGGKPMRNLSLLTAIALSFTTLTAADIDDADLTALHSIVTKADVNLPTTNIKKRDGHVKKFDANGKLRADMHFRHGVLDGTSTLYYPDGKVKKEMSYRNGRKEGNWKTYDKAGHLVSNLHYHEGRLDGLCRHYYDNGKTKDEISYRNGKVSNKICNISSKLWL
jgi:hypothetical protein